MALRTYLVSLVEELRLDLEEMNEAPTVAGKRSWIGVPELLDGMIVRLYPPAGINSGPADVYIRATPGGLEALPVHEYPALATDMDVVVDSDAAISDLEISDAAISDRWVICTALSRPVNAAQARDAVLIARISDDQRKGVTWFAHTLVYDNRFIQSKVVGHGKNVLLEELVSLCDMNTLGATEMFEGLESCPTMNECVYVQRGVAAPSSDPRQHARKLVWEQCAWLEVAHQIRSGLDA